MENSDQMRKIVWDDLPQDIASRILGKLAWSERARLCLVCKSWRRFFYEIKNTQEFLPWIFCFNSIQTSDDVSVCKLCDPFVQRSYTVKDAAIVNNKDFSGAVACDSRYGWVLFSKMIYGTISMNFFFYNPFTNEILKLPRMEKNDRKITCYEKATFSLSPSSPGCTVIAFSILRDGKLGIETCQPGDESWKMFEFLGDYKYNSILDVAYADESFYCTFVEGKMGAFNIKQQQWKVLTESLHRSGNCHHCLVVAFDGDLLLYWPCTEPIYDVIHTCCWRFDLSEMKWIENKKKQVIFEKCTSFSVPAMGNAKGSEGDYYFGSSYWSKPNYAWTLEDDIHFRGRIWIQPPFQYSSDTVLEDN